MSKVVVSKDTLFLLKPDFIDPKFPNQRFYCWHCALIEGVLLSFPNMADHLIIERVAWERPRKLVIDVVGEENQSLPLLVLATDRPSKFQTGRFENISFIAGKDKILEALSERHGFPKPHP